MDYVVAAAMVGVGLLAVATPLALATSLVRSRDRPGALPLLGVAVTLAVGSLLHVLVADPIAVGTAVESPVWTDDQWWVVQGATVTVVAGSVWSAFAFAYTGRAGLASVGAVASGAILSTAAIAVAAIAATEGVSAAHVETLSVVFLATAILVAVGVGLLSLASLRQNAFPIAEPLLLSAGAVVLCSGVLLAQRLDAAWLYLAANALAAGALLAPVRRYPLFDTLPAAHVAGRARVFEALSTGVIVVDRDGRVRDANDRAASLLDVDPEAVPGREFAELVGADLDPAAIADADAPVRLTIGEHRTLELTGRPIERRADRQVGAVVLCSDVTTRRVREEQFALLRRFVVDVVGDRMADVAADAAEATEAAPAETTGTADAASTSDVTEAAQAAGAAEDPEESASQQAADRIWTTTTALTRLVANARDVERAIGRIDAVDAAEETAGRADLRQTIDAVADVAAGSGAELAVETPDEPVETAVSQPLLRTILGTVIEDVCRRAETVDVAVTTADGPAIEITSIPAGDPNDGSANGDGRTGGLHSIAVARLAVEQAGGTLSTPVSEDGRITIELPGPETDGALLADRRRTSSGNVSLGSERLDATTSDDGGRP